MPKADMKRALREQKVRIAEDRKNNPGLDALYRADEELARSKERESPLTETDERYLSEFAYFLKSVVTILQSEDSEAKIERNTVASLLEPMVEHFHEYVHSDLQDRDSWDRGDREEGLVLVAQKRGAA